MMFLSPASLRALFLVSRHFRAALDQPHALWQAYFKHRTARKMGYTEFAPRVGETWREVVKDLANRKPEPFLLLGQPVFACGLQLPGPFGYWQRCPHCGCFVVDHKNALYYKERRYDLWSGSSRMALHFQNPKAIVFSGYLSDGYRKVTYSVRKNCLTLDILSNQFHGGRRLKHATMDPVGSEPMFIGLF